MTQPRVVLLVRRAGHDPVLLHQLHHVQELQRADVLLQDRALRSFDGERDDVGRIGLHAVHLRHLRIVRLEEIVDRLRARRLHAAEVPLGVMRMDAAGRTEQQARRAFRLDAGDTRCRLDADRFGHRAIRHHADLRALSQHGRIQQHLRALQDAADAHAQQRLALVDHARHGAEVAHLGVGRLHRADRRRDCAEFVELLGGLAHATVDRGQVAVLPATDHVADRNRLRMTVRLELLLDHLVHDQRRSEADLHARVGAVVGVLREVEARLAELANCIEERHEFVLRGVAAYQHRTVVAVLALRMVLPPFAGLGVDHFLVISAEQCDRGRATDAAADHRAGGEHQDVVRLDRTHLAARYGVQHAANLLQCLLQRLVSRRTTAAGAQHRTLRSDLREVELDVRALVIAHHENLHRVGPALDRVRNGEVADRQVLGAGAQRERREALHMLLLHAEADTGAAQQEPQRLAELPHVVDVSEGAVVHAGVVDLDRIAAELHRAHRGQRPAVAHRCLGGVDQVTEGAAQSQHFLREQGAEARAVHVEHTLRRFRPQLATAQVLAIARVLGHRDVVADATDAVPRDAGIRLLGSVQDVALGDVEVSGTGDHHLDDVLNFLNRWLHATRGAQLHGVGDHAGDPHRLGVIHQAQAVMPGLVVTVRVVGAPVSRGEERQRDRAHDSLGIPRGRATVTLPDGLVCIRRHLRRRRFRVKHSRHLSPHG